MTTFIDLIAAGEDVNSAMEFINDGSFTDMLDVIGDVEVDAAKMALKQGQRAKTQRPYVEMALTHLQTAGVAYDKIVDRSPAVRLAATPFERNAAALKGTWVACFSALCHYALGETENLRADLDRARRLRDISEELDTRQGRTIKRHDGSDPLKMYSDPDFWVAAATGTIYTARALLHPVRSAKALASAFRRGIEKEELDAFAATLLPDGTGATG